MKIKIEDLRALRLYGGESEGSTLSLKVGKPQNGAGISIKALRPEEGNG